jgi:hypothetical protein
MVEAALRSDPNGGPEAAAAALKTAGTMPDAATAFQWTDSLPAGSVRDAARAGAFQRFASTDTAAASDWLNAQPADTPYRDEMVQALVMRIPDTDLESAVRWAASIQDEGMRRRVGELVQSRMKKEASGN